MTHIKLVDVKKEFNDSWITRGVNLDIPKGKMTAIIGRSGEGKSVLLKQIIGLIKPTSGSVFVDGVNITELSKDKLYEHYKKFGYVFQFAALLDSLTIFENIAIMLLEQGKTSQEALPVVKEIISLVHLPEDCLHKYPADLSGGMRKRVGLARTLTMRPHIILYDEPTTGLDPITTRVIHELMADMQRKLQVTSVVVSHDPEIFNYADFVALLHEGIIQYFGPAKSIWHVDNAFVHQFIRGHMYGPIQTDFS